MDIYQTIFAVFLACLAAISFRHYLVREKRDSWIFSLAILILLAAIFLSYQNTSIEVKALGMSLTTKMNQIESQQKELTRIVTSLTQMIETVEQKPSKWGAANGEKLPVSEDLKKLEKGLHPYIKQSP